MVPAEDPELLGTAFGLLTNELLGFGMDPYRSLSKVLFGDSLVLDISQFWTISYRIDKLVSFIVPVFAHFFSLR